MVSDTLALPGGIIPCNLLTASYNSTSCRRRCRFTQKAQSNKEHKEGVGSNNILRVLCDFAPLRESSWINFSQRPLAEARRRKERKVVVR